MLELRRPQRRGPRWRALFHCVAVACLALSGCTRPVAPPAIVGAWYVTIPDAPYPYHLFVFHSDGTVEQSNPDGGDPQTSDSNLMGAWTATGDQIRAKLVETDADRTTHQFVNRTEIAMTLQVQLNSVHGTGTASAFDAQGKPSGDAHPFTLDGTRIVP